MIILLPLLWLAGWLIVGLVVGALSGLSPGQGGIKLFLIIFLGGGVGLPIVGGVARMFWRRLKNR